MTDYELNVMMLLVLPFFYSLSANIRELQNGLIYSVSNAISHCWRCLMDDAGQSGYPVISKFAKSHEGKPLQIFHRF